MFIGQASAHIDRSASRPQDIGYGSDPSNYNPIRRNRISSEDTQGAFFVPDKDTKVVVEYRRRNHTSSVPFSPPSSPVRKDSGQRAEFAPLYQDGATQDNSYTARIRFTEGSTSPETYVVHLIKEEVREARGNSPEPTMSGSSNLASHHVGALLHPHFAYHGTLKAEPESYLLNDRGRSTSVPYLGPLKRHSVSLPRDHEMDQGQSREDSSSSVDSYLRANAFLGHRETLARIEHTLDANSSDSASLPLCPPSYTFSIPSSALSRHRGTFARIDFVRGRLRLIKSGACVLEPGGIAWKNRMAAPCQSHLPVVDQFE
jgi:hypothetical protein